MEILVIFFFYLFAICSLHPQQGYLLAQNDEVEPEKDYELKPTAEKLQVFRNPEQPIDNLKQAISEEKSKEIDTYIQYIMEEQKIPGLALAITYNGEILKKKNKIRLSPTSPLMSRVTKQHTWQKTVRVKWFQNNLPHETIPV